MQKPLIAAEQIRAARKLLKWTQEHLADVSGVSMPIISFMENNKPKPGRRAFEDVRMAFERAGVEFPEGEAPRIKP